MINLSIVTPSLNSANTLRSTLESIRPLIDAGAQHILVDSGSTDSTLEIANEFGSLIQYHPPGNMYSAINAGMLLANHKWLTYINSDDILYSDYVIDVLSRPLDDISFIYGDLDSIDETGRFLFSRRSPNPRLLKFLIQNYSCIPQQGTLFTRALYNHIGGFNENLKYVADREFFSQCLYANCKCIKYSKKSVAAFRLSETQLSQTKRKEMTAEGRYSRKNFSIQHSLHPTLPSNIFANLYRWILNVDKIFFRYFR